MKINFRNKIIIKSISVLFIVCAVFMGCNDDDIDRSGKVSISFGDDSVFVLDDVGVGLIQLELTDPFEGEYCHVHLKSSIEESERFSFPEYITLYQGTIRQKYPIYVNESKFSSPNEHVTFTLDKVSNEDFLAIDGTKKTVEFIIEGKNNAGKVFIGFEHGFEAGEVSNKEQFEYIIGEDQPCFELPFEIQGVLEDSVKLKVTCHEWTPGAGETAVPAIEGKDFTMTKEIQIGRAHV